MRIKLEWITLLFIALLAACVNMATNSPERSETPTPFSLPSTWTPAPVSNPFPTETATTDAVNLISVEPTHTIFPTPSAQYEIPIFPGVETVERDISEYMTGKRGYSVYYVAPATISEIESFYRDELTREGWTWVYTDSGESLTPTLLSPTVIMEFHKDGHKLGIVIQGFAVAGAEVIVLAGVDISGGELTMAFIGAVSGGLDWMGPSEVDTRPDAMHFTSNRVEFSHPFNWLVTDQLMEIYHTDEAVNYRPQADSCRTTLENCFVNFWTGSHFDIPVSIRAHPEWADLPLEEASTLRWEQLQSIAAARNKGYYFPEELAVEGSLESIDVHTFTLKDGTPAVQHMYRWKQTDVAEPIISTYTLFRSGVVLLEFHTDFLSQEWEEVRATFDQVISSIKIVP